MSREIDWQIVPLRNMKGLRLIAGEKELVFTETEFESLLAKGEGTLRELDMMKRRRSA